MKAREEILSRIRLAQVAAPDHAVRRDYSHTRELPDVLGHFVERVEDYKATVIRTSPDGVAFSKGNPTDPTTPALDHNVADQLADLSNSTDSPDATYQAMIGRLGVSAQAVGRRSEIQDAVRDQVDTSRTAESGVNLDEEMTNMLTYQRGYEAASRVLTTIDSMLDQLINRTGLVGR